MPSAYRADVRFGPYSARLPAFVCATRGRRAWESCHESSATSASSGIRSWSWVSFTGVSSGEIQGARVADSDHYDHADIFGNGHRCANGGLVRSRPLGGRLRPNRRGPGRASCPQRFRH